MKTLGNDIYIRRGETWSLDFEVVNSKGEPYMLFSEWKNPFLVITVASARYDQKGDFRRTWWLDLDNSWKQNADGTMSIVPIKRFAETNAVYTRLFDVGQILADYEGQITLDNIENYLFFNGTDYKYLNGEIWETYNFRIIKQFNTKDWIEQNYLYDIRILAGERVDEHIHGVLTQQGATDIPALPWADEVTVVQLARITDETIRQELTELFESGCPLMPDYDVDNVILLPTKLVVSSNIQRGK